MSMTDGQQALYEHIVANGSGSRDTLVSLIKALSGDMVLNVSPSTVSESAGSTGFTQAITVTLKTSGGEVCSWYNGPVTLAIADTSTAGTASISPAAGSHDMTDGVLTVTLTGSAAAWVAADTATLTVSAAIFGYELTVATCVVTVS
ncbi:MAG: hypothetical protein H6Q67_2261 [Firmicutes bacterium]|nr:hypothetical protein [Bacillota bacterium]